MYIEALNIIFNKYLGYPIDRRICKKIDKMTLIKEYWGFMYNTKRYDLFYLVNGERSGRVRCYDEHGIISDYFLYNTRLTKIKQHRWYSKRSQKILAMKLKKKKKKVLFGW